MGLYVKHSLVMDILQQMDNRFKLNRLGISNSSNKLNFSFTVHDEKDRNFRDQLGVTFRITIQTEQELSYAKNLNSFYLAEIKPFLEKNKNSFKHLPEPFNRFFFLNGVTTSWMCGKTIHNTQLSHWVSTHYPEGNNFLNVLWTPQEYGHVSHFRTSLKDLHERNISITDLKFDINYYLCYYKPLVKKFNSQILF